MRSRFSSSPRPDDRRIPQKMISQSILKFRNLSPGLVQDGDFQTPRSTSFAAATGVFTGRGRCRRVHDS
jgi:hypothetical protein